MNSIDKEQDIDSPHMLLAKAALVTALIYTIGHLLVIMLIMGMADVIRAGTRLISAREEYVEETGQTYHYEDYEFKFLWFEKESRRIWVEP